MKNVSKDKIGAFVATELHGMCSWSGETVSLWVKFDCDVRSLCFSQLNDRIVDAVVNEENSERPEGYMWTIAFVKKEEPWGSA